MTDLQSRLRRLHDVPPLTVGEVTARAARQRRRRAGAVAATVVAAAAAVVSVVAVAAQHPHVHPVVVGSGGDQVKRGGVYVALTVADPAVVRGHRLAVEVDVVNATGHPLPATGCEAPQVRLYLDDGTRNNQQMNAGVGCVAGPLARHALLSSGHHRSRQLVSSNYAFCLGRGGASLGNQIPPCSPAGTPPLPVGRYRLMASLSGMPAGTVGPAAVAVTVVPSPLNATDLGSVPSGWGRLAGRLGPGDTSHLPDLPLTFSAPGFSYTTTAIGGVYEIDLPAGTWSVKGPGVCATGLTVGADGWQMTDLVYPLNGCQGLGR